MAKWARRGSRGERWRQESSSQGAGKQRRPPNHPPSFPAPQATILWPLQCSVLHCVPFQKVRGREEGRDMKAGAGEGGGAGQKSLFLPHRQELLWPLFCSALYPSKEEAAPHPRHFNCALVLWICGHMHSQIFGWPRPGGLTAVDVWWQKAVRLD